MQEKNSYPSNFSVCLLGHNIFAETRKPDVGKIVLQAIEATRTATFKAKLVSTDSDSSYTEQYQKNNRDGTVYKRSDAFINGTLRDYSVDGSMGSFSVSNGVAIKKTYSHPANNLMVEFDRKKTRPLAAKEAFSAHRETDMEEIDVDHIKCYPFSLERRHFI